ncbi:zinc-dependent alcohol dehydrogenase family protein [Thermocoleostomius sinensis]|uniref:Zinc-dependent alcohol dehydrogenase family protein n=1 Tax=Thermocoleostomius sinensis A174 TaxID=2016057 RepID=A0A9E8ZDN8_9CYAN|nr:zinc-dependent alcohol dehydrogenase family protein [Thermocoleostomius sinensis]WAL61027.1 zinc-dependent alcohol dehydrogenase family protein [Thermocoleostomius sinensis A174]
MKAILMTAIGSPDVLQVQTLPTPILEQDTQLLVRLKAAGVNPIDTKLRQRGTFYPDRMPAVLGCDGAGIVEAVGSAVQQFRVGDAVYFCNGGLGGHPGNYAEYAIVDQQFVAHKPKSISFAEAAAAPLVLITAWEALYDRGRLEAGQQVLIQAGAGGVGHVAIQLAKLAGATVCTTVSSPEKAEFVTQLGADQPILYKQVDPVDAVLHWTKGEGVDLAFDTVGGAVLSQSFAATSVYGDVVTLLAPNTNTDWKTARDRNLRVSFELMLTPMLKGLVKAQQEQAKILRQCARLIDQGQLTIHVGQTFSLDQAAAAHQCLESGSMMGKLVLLID